MGKDVIIACDFSSKEQTLQFLELFQDKKPFVKIGMELFYAEGPSIVREIKERGHRIFLDLKLHDIPNTVKKAMRNLSGLGVDILNVHAAGTIEMMQAAKQGIVESGYPTLLLAITQLTSTSEEQLHTQLLIVESMEETIRQYAKNAKMAGLDGVVCSPLEATLVKEECGTAFLTVTPGVRFSEETKEDQKRVTTPKEAKQMGSDYIVVGRPITSALDPVAAYNKCMEEFCDE